MGILQKFKPSLLSCCMFRSTSTTEELFEFDSLVLDLQEDILSRLSQKQLHRCRCVSKHWRTLINSKQFILACQLRHRLQDHSEGSSTIIGLDYSVSVSINFSTKIVCSILTPNHAPFELDRYEITQPTVEGCCNGLECFRNDTSSISRKLWAKSIEYSKYSLYDLKTGAYTVIPPLLTKYSSKRAELFHGFGYDSVGDDYKVISMIYHEQEKFEEFYVYSFKANSWQSYGKSYQRRLLYPMHRCATAVSLHNALHWFRIWNNRFENDEQGIQIIGFDLGTHESFELAPPDGKRSDILGDLASLKGRLHIISISYSFHSKPGLCVWVMKEYGIKRPWTKIYSCPLNIIGITNSDGLPPRIFPLSFYAFSQDGKEILIGPNNWRDGEAVRFNLETKEIKFVNLLASQLQ